MPDTNSPVEAPHWIVAERDTVIKPGEKPSSQYLETELVRVKKEDRFFVSTFEEAPGNHWRVVIDDEKFHGIGERSIFDGPGTEHSHWLKSWENDPTEAEVIAAPQVVSTKPKATPVGAGLTPEMPFDTRITPNITYGEFALYQEERRFDRKHQCKTAYEIAMFLEEVREHFDGSPVRVTSGSRPHRINASVGGSTYSEHLFDRPDKGAVDFYIVGVSVHTVQDYADKHWPYSIGHGADRGFVHLGMRPGRPRVRWPY